MSSNEVGPARKAARSIFKSRQRKVMEDSHELKRLAPSSGTDEQDGDGREARGLLDDGDLQEITASEGPEVNTVRLHKAQRRSCCWSPLIYALITLLFLVLLYASFRASSQMESESPAKILSNGTSNFLPTTIVISLDGFRADFLNRGLTPTLNSFIKEGVSPLYMLPSFPSVTFPNHYTLVTGLYPESHGIVGNTFWDPTMKEEFDYGKSSSMQAKWWGGEPLWVTAEKQGIRTAIHMWPGSEAHIGSVEPAYIDKFNATEDLQRKVDRIMEWLDLPGYDEPEAVLRGQRPQLIALYVPVVDADGHKYGPNSTEIRGTIKRVDNMLSSTFTGLEERNLTKVVSVIVVSDHGMATTSTDRLIQLDDLVDPDLVEHMDGWPLYGLRPKRAEDLEVLYGNLSSNAVENPNYDVYLRDENMPERYHFSHNDRIAPLWIVPKTGWGIVAKKVFDVPEAKSHGKVYHPRGLHGYDHEHPLMRAIFVARGPAFPHQPSSKLEIFQNTEVYNIICDSLWISPKPNNGTLRLPLKPIGVHADNGTEVVETPDDPPAPMAHPPVTSFRKPLVGVDQPEMEPKRPVIGHDNKKDVGIPNKVWKTVSSKLNKLKSWMHELLSGSTDSGL